MLAQLKKHLTLHELWEDAKFFFLLNLGLVATAVGIAVFKTPNHFAFGGTSGLSIVLATLFPRWNVGAFMWFINAALVVLGFVFLGVRSMGWTIYSSFALSFYVSLCERVCPLSAPLTSDAFLELCFAVILSAVGAAIVFNIGASTGGTDIVAMILNKYTSMPVGRALMVSDLGIVLVGGRVQNVDALALIVELQNRRGNGNTALLFNVHPVGHRMLGALLAFDRTCGLDGPTVEQELFGECGFTGVGVRDDRKCAPGFDFFAQ